MTIHRMMSAAVLAAVIAVGGVASADLTKGVINAFKGQLVVSKAELPEGKNDKETIAKIKAAKVSTLEGEVRDDVAYYNFHYTAFLSKTGASKLKMEFYKGKQLSADKTLDGIDPKSAVLSGDISINEDEGLAKGTTYTVKLINERNVVVAQSPLTMK